MTASLKVQSPSFTGYTPPTPQDLAVEQARVSQDLGERYEVRDFISHGGFASVWHVVDKTDGQELAVKRLRPNAVRTRDFFRELRATLNINHPNVVRLVNFLEAGEERYFILELCRGGSLRQAISRARKLEQTCTPLRTAQLLVQLAGGLSVAHAMGLTHRDLKPENVLFTEQTQASFGGTAAVKLADFGLASVRHSQDDGRLRAITGSPAYMAPEQFTGTFAPTSDVYALGVLAFELLTGDIPFMGSPEELAYQHLQKEPDWSLIESQSWRKLLQGMLNKQPEARPTAQQVAEKLGARKIKRNASVPNVKVTEVAAAASGITVAGTNTFVSWDIQKVTRWNTAGEKLAETKIEEGTRIVCSPNTDEVWIVTHGQLDRWLGHGELVRMPSPPIVASQIIPYEKAGVGRAFILDADRLEMIDLITGLSVWSRKNLNLGPKPVFNRMADGTLACVSLVDRPFIRFFDASGQDIGQFNLPGIAWQATATKHLVAMRVLTGHGFRAVLVDRAGSIIRLENSEGIAHIAANTTAIFGLWPDGRLKTWTHKGVPLPNLKVPFAVGRIRGIAASGNTLAILTDETHGSALRFLTVAPRGET